MKLTLLTASALSLFALAGTHPPDAQPYENISNKHKLLWKTKMGCASFRTNVNITDSSIIIGSNGNDFMDRSFVDFNSGVYIINRYTGKKINVIDGNIIGDLDVNGTLVYNNKLYYGNDNEEFICRSLDGKEIWRNVASGDVEHEPVLINDGNKNYIVYASELGEVDAVDPESGKKIWSYFTPDFSGWKNGDNRIIFKVRAFLSYTQSFFTKPDLVDLNSDGVKDLVYITFDNVIRAIDGKKGKQLWFWNSNNVSIQQVLEIEKKPSGVTLSFLGYKYGMGIDGGRGFMVKLSEKGAVLKEEVFEKSSMEINSLNSINISQSETMFAGEDSLYIMKNNVVAEKINHADYYEYENWDKSRKTESRVSSGSLFGNKVFRYNNHKRCVLLLSQHDGAKWGTGFIEIIDLDSKSVVRKLSLESPSEMPPQIVDINKDGKDELLLNCYDGYLYCYSLN